jgi:hypothetical protein
VSTEVLGELICYFFSKSDSGRDLEARSHPLPQPCSKPRGVLPSTYLSEALAYFPRFELIRSDLLKLEFAQVQSCGLHLISTY